MNTENIRLCILVWKRIFVATPVIAYLVWLARQPLAPFVQGANGLPTIAELRAAGCESLRDIAAALDQRGIPAAKGGKWSATQVMRLLEAAAGPRQTLSSTAR